MPKLQTSVGAALLSIVNAKSPGGNSAIGLTTANVPDVSEGNSRTVIPAGAGTTTALDHTFTTFVGDASVTYNLESFPMYTGAFPIRVGGEYAENLLASSRNKGYGFGVTFGKSGKKGLWDISYRWKELQGDFWYEELVDSDFGGFYQTPAGAASSGIGQTAFGYGPGTNLRGHVIKTQYSPYDSFTLAATLYLADVIDTVAAGGVSAAHDSSVTRVQIDAIWKF